MKTSGFTVIEFLVVVILVGIIGSIGLSLNQQHEAMHRDRSRKVAINAIDADLREVVRPKLGGYPRTLDTTTLAAISGSLLTDPEGHKIGTASSDYRYEPTGCNGSDLCSGYTLRAQLEDEADFVKTAL